MLSGVLVGVVFLAVVWFVDRQDVQPLLAGCCAVWAGGGPVPGRRADAGRGLPERGDGKETAAR